MAHYLIQGSYTADAWAKLVKSPQDRGQAIKPIVEKLDGKLLSFYNSFGEHDVVVIVEMPNNVSAAALSLAAYSGGALKNIKTTPLMTAAEGMDAMRKAAAAGYRPPS
jgi:uncharacterized protein with GYD domain